MPCALYYNININEDRHAAVEESKRYLEGYYAPQVFSRKAVEGWVACGPPEQCVDSFRALLARAPLIYFCDSQAGINGLSSGGASRRFCPT